MAKNNSPIIQKTMRYSVVTTHINFKPPKQGAHIIIVNGQLAVRIKGNLYTKM